MAVGKRISANLYNVVKGSGQMHNGKSEGRYLND